MKSTKRGKVLWFVGLPGSGKSTIAAAAREELERQGVDAVHLKMDERRKVYFPEPEYTDEEREKAYEMFADEAVALAREGKCALMDGTAPMLRLRQRARAMLPGDFAEVYIKCDLDTAIEREKSRPGGEVMAGLYEKALDRKQTGKEYPGLGEVPGVDTPFEENPDAEVVLDSSSMDIEDARDMIIAFLDNWA